MEIQCGSHGPLLWHAVQCLWQSHKELNHIVKARLHYQWAPVVLEYGNGKYVENDSVDANSWRRHDHFPHTRCYHTPKPQVLTDSVDEPWEDQEY